MVNKFYWVMGNRERGIGNRKNYIVATSQLGIMSCQLPITNYLFHLEKGNSTK